MLIHRCRLHLQVELLSDIVNDKGDCILDEWKGYSKNKSSRSHKRWPRQTDPGKEAWRAWKRFLEKFYENGNGKLRQHLGSWIKRNEHRTHDFYYDSESAALFRHDDQLWRKHKKTASTRRQMFFNKQDQSTLELILPEAATPINIVGQTNEHWITCLSSTQKYSKAHTRTPSSLIEKMKQTQPNLLETAHLIIDEQDLALILSQATHIETASDGGFDPNTGISSFGWIVAMNKTLIAKGSSPVAAHPELAESFRAEGYGLAAASMFLSILSDHFHVDKSNHIWKFYIDNKAMIQRMHNYQWRGSMSKWNLQSDADITNLAHDYLRNLPAILIHVKSHQDEQRDFEDLPFEAQLNILADAQATQHRDMMESPLTDVTGLQPVLIIDNVSITRDSQKWLLKKAGEVPLMQFYEEKHGWGKARTTTLIGIYNKKRCPRTLRMTNKEY